MAAGSESGCAARGAHCCPFEQSPAAQGLCAGAGTLLPARVSTQPVQKLPIALEGEAGGGRKNPWKGSLFLLFRGCCVVQGCSDLSITRYLQRGLLKDIEAALALEE